VTTDLIFCGEPGRDGQRRAYEFRMAWKKIIKDTKIANLRFHDLRHEAVSRLVLLLPLDCISPACMGGVLSPVSP
jgi:integrase